MAAPPWRTIALELVRGIVGLLILPQLLVTIPSDDYVTSLATGGEWVRLNLSGTTALCFGHKPAFDAQCHYLQQKHCETASGCIWADPTAHMCLGDDASCTESTWRSSCRTSTGCFWERQLDLRVECRTNLESMHGGATCDAILAKRPGALDTVRAMSSFTLTQVFGFILGNIWLIRYFGSIDALMARGKPLVAGLFLLTAAAGSLYRMPGQ